jgi:hypothetical protein
LAEQPNLNWPNGQIESRGELAERPIATIDKFKSFRQGGEGKAESCAGPEDFVPIIIKEGEEED